MPDWTMRRRSLCVRNLPEDSGTATNIRTTLESEFVSYELDREMFYKQPFVTDQGSSLKAALSYHKRYNCAVHSINLVLTTVFDAAKCHGDELDLIRSVITTSRSIVKRLKKSNKRSDYPGLVAPAPTRFNTNYAMLQSIQDNFEKLELQGFVDRTDIDSTCFINRDLLDELTEILRRLDYIIKAAQFDTRPTFHYVFLWATIDISNIFEIRHEDSPPIKTFKTSCAEIFKEKFVIDADHKIATVLHPEFRALTFIRSDIRNGIYSLLKDQMHNLDLNDSNENEAMAENSESLWSNYKATGDIDFETELELYLKAANVKDFTDPLTWWKRNEQTFPRLSRLAKRLLSIPCSNTTSERLFSAAAFTAQPKRNCLSSDKINLLTFLQSNLN